MRKTTTPKKKPAPKQRGNKKYIPTPERMMELFKAYQEETKGKPIMKNDFVGKNGDEVTRKLERPLTMDGFENYVADQGVINDLGDYFSNKKGKYSKFSTVCARIRRIIRQDQIEGGMAGIYSPSITQRLNGLVEKQENKNEITGKDGAEIKVTLII